MEKCERMLKITLVEVIKKKKTSITEVTESMPLDRIEWRKKNSCGQLNLIC